MIRRAPGYSRASRRAALAAALASLLASPGRAQGFADGGSGMSKPLRLAVEHFERGEDLQAMDRFMEVLTSGDPSERPMANEYMNLITQRMALGQAAVKAPQAPISREQVRLERPLGGAPAPISGPDREGLLPPPGQEAAPARETGLTRSDKEAMKKQIENRLQARANVALSRLRKYEDIRIYMASGRLPKTLGLPASLLFDGGVLFKKESAEILDILSDLSFSLGATQLVLLPERAMLGDSKILDMRRTMAISSHLFKAGLAPSRVRVNLLSNQVDVPRELQDFQGILVSFVYNQPLSLTSDNSLDAESGPPISVGISPGAIDPRKDEGAVIEFSVVEPPAGLMSWSFQLSGPGRAGAEKMTPLQNVTGSSPVFHQIFWNGRRGYFGEPLPGGRYQALLTATDMKGRTRKKLQWVSVEGAPPEPAEPAPGAGPAVGALARRAAGPPPAELSSDESPAPGPRRVTIARRRSPRRRAPARAVPLVPREEEPPAVSGPAEPSPAAAPAAPAPSGSVPESAEDARQRVSMWTVPFAKGTMNIAAEGEGQLSKAAETLSYYPLDSLQLVGFASRAEADAESLASGRAAQVGEVLAKRYKVDPKRIQRRHRVVDNDYAKVEIYVMPGK